MKNYAPVVGEPKKNTYILKTLCQYWTMKETTRTTGNQNRLTMCNEFESIIRNYQQRKCHVLTASLATSTKHLIEQPVLLKCSPVTEEVLWKALIFFEASMIMLPKPAKSTTRRQNHRLKSLMDVVAKILSEAPVNWIKLHLTLLCTFWFIWGLNTQG